MRTKIEQKISWPCAETTALGDPVYQQHTIKAQYSNHNVQTMCEYLTLFQKYFVA